MFQLPVMVVQSAASVFASVDEYEWTFRRFAEVAKSKEARLVIYPELAGLMLAPPLMVGVKSSLARTAGRGKEKKAPLLQKARGVLAGSVAGVLRANLHAQTARWLSQPANLALLEETYRAVFSKIASDLRLTVVAGSCYCSRSPATDVYNTAYVFGPDGNLLGAQEQTHLLSPVVGELSAGDHLTPIQTEVGSLGLLLGNDILFPEAARALAYQGVEVLVSLSAAPGNLAATRQRHAFQARVAENELFGVQSCLVGRNLWAEKGHADTYIGRSMIAGPMELVPRPNGVLTEMGESVQGLVAGVLDMTALHRWWADGATSLRRAMRPGIYQSQLSRFYRAGQTIHAAQMVHQLQQEEALPASRTGPWAGAIVREQPASATEAEEPSETADGRLPTPEEVSDPRPEEDTDDAWLTSDQPAWESDDAPADIVTPEVSDEREPMPDTLDEDELDDSRLKLWD